VKPQKSQYFGALWWHCRSNSLPKDSSSEDTLTNTTTLITRSATKIWTHYSRYT